MASFTRTWFALQDELERPADLGYNPKLRDLGQVHYHLRGSMLQVKGSGGANSTVTLSWLSCRGGAGWGPVAVALSADLATRS